jgi:sulfonate transport system permease protein
MSSIALDSASARVRPRIRWRLGPAWLRIVSPLVIVAAWQLLSSTGVLPARLLPSPIAIVHTAWSLLQQGTLQDAITVSLARAATGFAFGAVIGIGLALVAGLSPAFRVIRRFWRYPETESAGQQAGAWSESRNRLETRFR